VTKCTSPFGCDRVPYDHAGLCICHSEDPNKDVQAFQREIADMLQRRDHRFGGFVFPDEVRSASASFESAASFTGVTFQGAATFSGVRFEGKADFSGATFRGATVFRGEGISGSSHAQGARMPISAGPAFISLRRPSSSTSSSTVHQRRGVAEIEGSDLHPVPGRVWAVPVPRERSDSFALLKQCARDVPAGVSEGSGDDMEFRRAIPHPARTPFSPPLPPLPES